MQTERAAGSIRISIVTPVYNCERFIESCIRVVAEQNCPCAEHIIIDGGSTDRTVEIIRRCAEKFPRVRWLSERDTGQSDAMNKGVRLAAGEVLGFLNADDYYEPGVLNRVAEIFNALPRPGFLVGNCDLIFEDGAQSILHKPAAAKFYQMLHVARFMTLPVNPSSYFYHRSLHERIGGYDVREYQSMDFDFLLRALPAARVFYLDETLGNMRFYPGTKTMENLRRGKLQEIVLRVARRHAARKGWLHRIYIALAATLEKERVKPSRTRFDPRAKQRLLSASLRLCECLLDATSEEISWMRLASPATGAHVAVEGEAASAREALFSR